MTKRKNPALYEKRGRPAAVTDAVVDKMLHAAALGLNNNQTAVYAGISKDVLYKYMREHPDIKDRLDTLRNRPAAVAVANVVNEIDRGNIDASKWYLERKCRDEYGTRPETAIAIAGVGVLADKENALADYMRGFLGLSGGADDKNIVDMPLERP